MRELQRHLKAQGVEFVSEADESTTNLRQITFCTSGSFDSFDTFVTFGSSGSFGTFASFGTFSPRPALDRV